jgi:hypothetical protein
MICVGAFLSLPAKEHKRNKKELQGTTIGFNIPDRFIHETSAETGAEGIVPTVTPDDSCLFSADLRT